MLSFVAASHYENTNAIVHNEECASHSIQHVSECALLNNQRGLMTDSRRFDRKTLTTSWILERKKEGKQERTERREERKESLKVSS